MGGLGDGYAFQSSIQTNCTALNIQSIFTGGSGNGYNFRENIQVACTPQNLQSIFSGGNGNGYNFKENIQEFDGVEIIFNDKISNKNGLELL